jgi:hypothetical protein
MKFISVLLAVTFAGLAFSEDRIYIGAAKCARMCHKSAKQGGQLPKWEKSRHAAAYKTLATPAALETARKAGVTGDPRKSDKCLRCHVTAFGVDAKLLQPTYSVEEGVGCEACHGPGKDYSKLSVMKNREQSLAAGLVEPEETVCVKCHNKESPTFKAFDFKAMAAKIAHPVPRKD